MAELILLIYIGIIVFVAYFVGRYFDTFTGVAVTWFIAAVLIAVGIGLYGKSKVDTAKKGWLAPYKQIEDGTF